MSCQMQLPVVFYHLMMNVWSDPQKSYHLQREVIGINS